jgi:LytR cell envelope-related transcriptional attenuator/cell envelope-related transcriptional attenuator-like protein
VSNLLGVWAEHYAVLEPEGLAALVDRMGGIQVDLLRALETESGTLESGTAELTGDQVVQYLDASGPNLELYWGTVLQGLFAERPRVSESDLSETDDPIAARRLLVAAEGATVEPLPTVDLGGDPDAPLIQADERAASELVESVFGYRLPQPVPVLVVNGSGRPGVGQSVAARIIPAGFRVILGQNDEEFDTRHTKVIATGSQHLDDADRAQRALGSGEVAVTEVPSGLADVTIVVGTDYGSG